MRHGLLAFFVLFLTFSLNGYTQILKDKIMIGRVEWVELPDLKMKFRSRIDTGAKTTSIHAFGVEEVRREDGLYVKFKTRDANGKEAEAIRKVESTQKVANAGGFTGRRYVIREKVKLGSVIREISLNLNDRDKMAYKLLVGRNFLLGHFTVDVARSHVLGD
ncbi:MAG: RimK/LysX family protein [Bacteriovoracaceae bacterium]|nr:RimK/LysX family protein [Bacteriovoracaceae bacterium]